MIVIERLRALEKEWRDAANQHVHDYAGCTPAAVVETLRDCADELAILIAELGQEVGAVADSRRPLDAALAIAFWDARKTINESPDWVTPVEVIHWGDEIVRNARRYGTQPSPAHTSEARDAVADATEDLVAAARVALEALIEHGDATQVDLEQSLRNYDAAMRQEGGTP